MSEIIKDKNVEFVTRYTDNRGGPEVDVIDAEKGNLTCFPR